MNKFLFQATLYTSHNIDPLLYSMNLSVVICPCAGVCERFTAAGDPCMCESNGRKGSVTLSRIFRVLMRYSQVKGHFCQVCPSGEAINVKLLAYYLP